MSKPWKAPDPLVQFYSLDLNAIEKLPTQDLKRLDQWVWLIGQCVTGTLAARESEAADALHFATGEAANYCAE